MAPHRFLFQPAEEGPGGAEPMVAEGCMVGVTDGVFGFHNVNLLPLGMVWVQPDVASAHCFDFEIVVTGKGGHASMPHLCKDPLLAASHIVVALNNVVSRRCACFHCSLCCCCRCY